MADTTGLNQIAFKNPVEGLTGYLTYPKSSPGAVNVGVRTAREILKDIIDQLLAIETMEYHDKNLLSGDNKTRCEWKLEKFNLCLDIIKRFE